MNTVDGTTSAPPRATERLLTALGASAAYRDAVLGDLAEEFARRAACDGPHAARGWYWREALRATPHLIGDWRRQLRPRDVADLAGIVFLAFVALNLVAGFAAVAAHTAATAVGLAFEVGLLVSGTAGLLVTAPVAYAGGYLAGWLGSRAPLPTALAMGGAWACLASVNLHPSSAGRVPFWFHVAAPLLVVLGTALGGAHRAATAVPEAVA